MRALIKALVGMMIILSSNAFLQLIRDGGARDQGLSAETLTSDSFLDALPRIWGIVSAVVLAVLIISGRLGNRHWPDRLIALLVVFGAVSAAWAQYSADALRVALLLAAAYGLIHAQVSITGPRQTLRYLGRICLAINISSLVFIILLPSYGVSVGDHAGEWQGVFDHKNGLGNFAVLAYVVSLWWHRQDKNGLTRFAILLPIALIFGSHSNTAIVNFAVCTAVILALKYRTTAILLIRLRFAFFICMAGTLALQLYTSVFEPERASFLFGNDATFTGRTTIWLAAIRSSLDAIYFGHGIGQYAKRSLLEGGGDLASTLGFIVGSTHNGFLDLLYSLGIAGAILFTAVLARLILNSKSADSARVQLVFAVMLTLLNFTEARLIGFNIYFVGLIYARYFAATQRKHIAMNPVIPTVPGAIHVEIEPATY